MLKKIIGLSVLILALIFLPLILKNQYYLHVVIMMGINSILTMGLVLLLSTGLVTLGAAAFWGIGAYASALLVMKAGLIFWLALPIAGIISGIIALGIGMLIIRLSKLAFIFLTIIFCAIVTLVIGRFDFLGGWGGFVGIPGPESISLTFNGTIEFAHKDSYYYLVLFLLLLTIIVFYALYNSRIGRAWRAIKLNPRLAQSLGINCYKYSLLAFIIAAIFAGLAGSFFATYTHSIQPDTFGFWKSVYILVYAILGGINFYLLGPMVGSIILTLIPEVFRIAKEIEPIITGAILTLTVIFLPGGLLSLIHSVYARSSPSKGSRFQRKT